jgi:hypothetical protein
MKSDCPEKLINLDANSTRLWPKLLKRTQVTVDRAQDEIVADKRGMILSGIGLPDLIFRLECQKQREKDGQQDELARARIWFHVAEACAPGDSVPELNGENRYLLNPWIIAQELKYTNPRLAALNEDRLGGVQLCANDRCKKGADGQRAIVTDGKYCSNACRSSMGRRLPPKSHMRRRESVIRRSDPFEKASFGVGLGVAFLDIGAGDPHSGKSNTNDALGGAREVELAA